MKCGESIFAKEKRWGDIWQKEDEGRPRNITWTLMKVKTLGVNPSLVVEFGSVPGMLGYEVPRGRSHILECVVRHRGWDPSQKHHLPVAWEGRLDGAGTQRSFPQPWLDVTEVSREVGLPRSPRVIPSPQPFPMYLILLPPHELLIAE